MRNLGEFFGHIVKGAKEDPAKSQVQRREVNRTVEEREDEQGVVFRRTTIDEIEVRQGGRSAKSVGKSQGNDHNQQGE